MSEIRHVSIVATGGGQPSFSIEAPITEIRVRADLTCLSLDFQSNDGGAIVSLSAEMAQRLVDAINQEISKVGQSDDEAVIEAALDKAFNGGKLT